MDSFFELCDVIKLESSVGVEVGQEKVLTVEVWVILSEHFDELSLCVV